MEADTRLRFELPLPSFVTGIDIVKEQMRMPARRTLVVQAGRNHLQRPRNRVPRERGRSRETFVPSPGHISVFSLGGSPASGSSTASALRLPIRPTTIR